MTTLAEHFTLASRSISCLIAYQGARINVLASQNPLLVAVISCLILASNSASGQILIDTVAGGYIRSGVPAQNVALGGLSGVTRDAAGNLVFCDSSTNVIRRIQADGTVQTIAGIGIPGYGGDGGPAANAMLNNPGYPKYDPAGNLYFSDSSNYRIRRIDTSGTITTVAGTGIPGTLGMDGPAAQAQIDVVFDLVLDTAGYVYFVEYGQPFLRRLTPSGRIEVYAGCQNCEDVDGVPATQASLTGLRALAVDSAGDIYLSDQAHV